MFEMWEHFIKPLCSGGAEKSETLGTHNKVNNNAREKDFCNVDEKDPSRHAGRFGDRQFSDGTRILLNGSNRLRTKTKAVLKSRRKVSLI